MMVASMLYLLYVMVLNNGSSMVLLLNDSTIIHSRDRYMLLHLRVQLRIILYHI